MADFEGDDLKGTLKEFFRAFQCLPLKIDGKVELFFFDCGVCAHYSQQNSPEVPYEMKDCRGKDYGTTRCMNHFLPITKKDWFNKLVETMRSWRVKW